MKIGPKFWFLTQLFEPVRYLTIRQGISFNYKFIYDWGIPIVLSGFTLLILREGEFRSILIGKDSLADSLTPFIQLLAAFCIAALAAIATSAAKSLEKGIEGHEYFPLSIYRSKGREEISKRQLYCYLFGYLSMALILLMVLIFVLTKSYTSLIYNGTNKTLQCLENFGFGFIGFFVLFHIFTTAFLRMSFLTKNIPNEIGREDK